MFRNSRKPGSAQTTKATQNGDWKQDVPLSPIDSTQRRIDGVLVPPPPPPAVVPPRRRRRLVRLSTPLVWLWLLVFCLGTGVGAMLWLLLLPPLPDCKQPQQLAMDGERLYCAEQIAQPTNADSLVNSLDLIKDWSAEHPLYSRAVHLMDEWSSALLELARVKAVESNLSGAIALAEKIPPASNVSKDAKAAITTWQKDLNQGQAIVDSVQTAIQARKWGLAIQQLRLLARMDSDYWTQQVDRLRQQVSSEIIAAKQLDQARALAKNAAGNVQTLGRAIALAEQINPDTVTHTTAKAEVDRWTAALFAIVSGQLPPQIGLEQAMAAVQQLPKGVPVPDARDILWISRAQPLVTNPLPRGALYKQLWQLWNVFAQVRQIPPDSPLYPQAKSVLPKLQQQIQDVTQLNAASGLASLWQIPSLQLGIQVAHGIAPNRPRRIYAQTLITMWQKDIERVQDRPYLVQANQFASVGSPQTFQQAIVYARQIPAGRSLYPEAQVAIAQWSRQIELIEDEPVLNQAQALAREGRFTEAIQVAAQIRSGRSLYPEAQTAMGEWTYQTQVREDRPILERAYVLAEQGNRLAAINLASQIRPGRALYGEAQTAIATWSRPIRDDRSSSMTDLDHNPNDPSDNQNKPTSPAPNQSSGNESPTPSPSTQLPRPSQSSPYVVPTVRPSPYVVPANPTNSSPTPLPEVSPISPSELPLP
jgi:hypothetical protein